MKLRSSIERGISRRGKEPKKHLRTWGNALKTKEKHRNPQPGPTRQNLAAIPEHRRYPEGSLSTSPVVNADSVLSEVSALPIT
jgi:hypothetical protein